MMNEKNYDYTCLAEDCVFPANLKVTGVNMNELVVGPTGCGKSVSNSESRLLHTFHSSVVVPIAKKEIKTQFSQMFVDRGYQVIDLDFSCPENCEIGYDPLDYVHSDEDAINLAKNIVVGMSNEKKNSNKDPYWEESAVSIFAAEIMLIRLNAKSAGKRASFGDVIDLHHSLELKFDGGHTKTNIDSLFDYSEERYPGNQAAEMWKTMRGLTTKTASCIYSTLNNAVDKIFSKSIIDMMKKEERVSFKELGEKKIALFITTSPMNLTLQNYVNVMYADMIRVLFDIAESKENHSLDVPVHIVFDDFACGSKIADFENYISIFRGAGISATLLLQSESQLISMYVENAATTIINNCDSYVYMGGMDIATAKHISSRINKPVDKVLSMPLEQVYVFRRGATPRVARRYQTYEDPIYIDMIKSNSKER